MPDDGTLKQLPDAAARQPPGDSPAATGAAPPPDAEQQPPPGSGEPESTLAADAPPLATVTEAHEPLDGALAPATDDGAAEARPDAGGAGEKGSPAADAGAADSNGGAAQPDAPAAPQPGGEWRAATGAEEAVQQVGTPAADQPADQLAAQAPHGDIA